MTRRFRVTRTATTVVELDDTEVARIERDGGAVHEAVSAAASAQLDATWLTVDDEVEAT